MAAKKALNAIILGAPGGGKGTISKKLVKQYNFIHVSTGDMLRAHIQDPSSDLGQVAKGFIKDGALVPDGLVLNMLQGEVTKLTRQHSKPGLDAPKLLLDGFPRTVPQAKSMLTFMPVHCVIVLDIPHQTIIDRISNRMIHPASGRVYNKTYNPERVSGFDDVTGEKLVQREDDKPQTVQARLKAYDALTAPLIDFFSSSASKTATMPQPLIGRFQGTESDVIFPQICEWIKSQKLV